MGLRIVACRGSRVRRCCIAVCSRLPRLTAEPGAARQRGFSLPPRSLAARSSPSSPARICARSCARSSSTASKNADSVSSCSSVRRSVSHQPRAPTRAAPSGRSAVSSGDSARSNFAPSRARTQSRSRYQWISWRSADRRHDAAGRIGSTIRRLSCTRLRASQRDLGYRCGSQPAASCRHERTPDPLHPRHDPDTPQL